MVFLIRHGDIKFYFGGDGEKRLGGGMSDPYSYCKYQATTTRHSKTFKSRLS